MRKHCHVDVIENRRHILHRLNPECNTARCLNFIDYMGLQRREFLARTLDFEGDEQPSVAGYDIEDDGLHSATV